MWIELKVPFSDMNLGVLYICPLIVLISMLIRFREYGPIMDKPKVHKYLDSLGLVCYYYQDPSESESSFIIN